MEFSNSTDEGYGDLGKPKLLSKIINKNKILKLFILN